MYIPRHTILFLTGIIMISILVGSTATYFIVRARTSKHNAVLAAQQEVSSIVDKVGSLMVLPQSEVPTIATVSDITKLKDQPFFTNAQNGDKVLMYSGAKKAILYRPSNNKIIEVAPLTIPASSTSEGATSSGAMTTPVTISVSVAPPHSLKTIINLPTKNHTSPTLTPVK